MMTDENCEIVKVKNNEKIAKKPSDLDDLFIQKRFKQTTFLTMIVMSFGCSVMGRWCGKLIFR